MSLPNVERVEGNSGRKFKLDKNMTVNEYTGILFNGNSLASRASFRRGARLATMFGEESNKIFGQETGILSTTLAHMQPNRSIAR